MARNSVVCTDVP